MLQLIWDVPEGFATLVAGIVAIIAAIIAWLAVQRQIRAVQQVEATKLRLDLYNRRFQIFESIFDFYDALWQWAGTAEQKAVRRKFFRASEEAGFLFSNEFWNPASDEAIAQGFSRGHRLQRRWRGL